MIDGDAWRLAPRSGEKQATAVPAMKEQKVWLFAPSNTGGSHVGPGPCGSSLSHRFLFHSLVCEYRSTCVRVFGIRQPQVSLSLVRGSLLGRVYLH